VSEPERDAPTPEAPETGEAGEAGEAPAAPEEESRFHRGLRYTHRTGLYAALLIAIAAIVYLVLLVARNTRQVKLDYVFDTTEARLIWLIIISAITGWVLGIVTSFLIRRRTRWRRPT
jgi:uncharacterized integral membrane protein